MFALSFVSHLRLFSLVLRSMSSAQFLPAEESITYVDMITPPVASPQVGTPAAAEEQTRKSLVAQQSAHRSAKPAPIPPQVAGMRLPLAKPKPLGVIPIGTVKVEQAIPAEDGREFDGRLAGIQQGGVPFECVFRLKPEGVGVS